MLQRLLLRNLRCFAEVELELPEDGAIFLGANGEGKTTLLEAVCLLLRLQSPRTRKQKELIQFEKDHFLVEGRVTPDRGLRVGYRAGERKLSIDDSPVDSVGEYLQQSGRVVWMGNRDIELVRGDALGRRQFLDFVGSQLHPEYRQQLRTYEKALQRRNLLLKSYPLSWPQIDAYSAILVEAGEQLMSLRASVTDAARPFVEQAHATLSGGAEMAAIEWKPSAQPGSFAATLDEARENDARRRFTTVGPHRDDLLLTLDGKRAGDFGSEGQQRSLSLALKLAQAQLLDADGGFRPVLLIDDVFGELDVQRRNALLGALPDGLQKLITTTYLDWAEETMDPLPRWEVAHGEVRKN